MIITLIKCYTPLQKYKYTAMYINIKIKVHITIQKSVSTQKHMSASTWQSKKHKCCKCIHQHFTLNHPQYDYISTPTCSHTPVHKASSYLLTLYMSQRLSVHPVCFFQFSWSAWLWSSCELQNCKTESFNWTHSSVDFALGMMEKSGCLHCVHWTVGSQCLGRLPSKVATDHVSSFWLMQWAGVGNESEKPWLEKSNGQHL